MRWYEQGKNPDYRFSLANERTYLAWTRTALAILAGAVLLGQLDAGLMSHRLVVASSLGLSLLAGVIGAGAYFQWRRNEHAMRLDQALPRSILIPVLTASVAVVAGIASVLVLAR